MNVPAKQDRKHNLTVSPAERDAVFTLLGDYGWYIDESRFDEWIDLFDDECRYNVVPRENLNFGMSGSLLLCESKDMLRDRITALLEANKYNIHVSRHVIGMPRVNRKDADTLLVEASDVVFQTNQEGELRPFSVGTYIDSVDLSSGSARIKEKLVIVDSFSIPTLLATPL